MIASVKIRFLIKISPFELGRDSQGRAPLSRRNTGARPLFPNRVLRRLPAQHGAAKGSSHRMPALHLPETSGPVRSMTEMWQSLLLPLGRANGGSRSDDARTAGRVTDTGRCVPQRRGAVGPLQGWSGGLVRRGLRRLDSLLGG